PSPHLVLAVSRSYPSAKRQATPSLFRRRHVEQTAGRTSPAAQFLRLRLACCILWHRVHRLLGFLLLLGPAETLAAQADLPFARIDAQHLHLDGIAHLDDFFRTLD